MRAERPYRPPSVMHRIGTDGRSTFMLQLNELLEQLGFDALLGRRTENLREWTDIAFLVVPSPGQSS